MVHSDFDLAHAISCDSHMFVHCTIWSICGIYAEYIGVYYIDDDWRGREHTECSTRRVWNAIEGGYKSRDEVEGLIASRNSISNPEGVMFGMFPTTKVIICYVIWVSLTKIANAENKKNIHKHNKKYGTIFKTLGNRELNHARGSAFCIAVQWWMRVPGCG